MRTKVTIELFKHVQNIQLMCFACVEDENWICDDVSTNIMKLGGEKNNDYDAALSESTSRRITSPSRTQLTQIVFTSSSDEANETFIDVNVIDQSYDLPTNKIRTKESAISSSIDADDNHDYFHTTIQNNHHQL